MGQTTIPVVSVRYRGVQFRVARLDQAYPHGNKHFKLKYNLREAKRIGADTILSFGGAWSNHIHALAHVGQAQGFRTVGVIRGEASALSPTLTEARAWGMRLEFVSRAQYREKDSPAFRAWLNETFGDPFVLPEGGTNALAMAGCAEIVHELDQQEPYDVLCVPVGTGGTLAGLATALGPGRRVEGVAVLKARADLERRVQALLATVDHGLWSIDHDYPAGGYARAPGYLLEFIAAFEAATGIALEPVYSGKLMYAVWQKLQRGEYPTGTRVLALHTGGLQGRRGFPSLGPCG